MPNGWTRVGTPAQLRALLDRPTQFEAKANQLVEESGAVVGHIFWDAPGGPAYILTHVPAVNADEVFRALDRNIGRTQRLYNTEEAKRLQRRRRR